MVDNKTPLSKFLGKGDNSIIAALGTHHAPKIFDLWDLPSTDEKKTLYLLSRYSKSFIVWIRICLLLFQAEPSNDVIGVRFATTNESKYQIIFLKHVIETITSLCGMPEGRKVCVSEVSGQHILVYVCGEGNPISETKVFSKNGKQCLRYIVKGVEEEAIQSGPQVPLEKVKHFTVILDLHETVPPLNPDEAGWVKNLFTSIHTHNDFIVKLNDEVDKKTLIEKKEMEKQRKTEEIQRQGEEALEDGLGGLFD